MAFRADEFVRLTDETFVAAVGALIDEILEIGDIVQAVDIAMLLIISAGIEFKALANGIIDAFFVHLLQLFGREKVGHGSKYFAFKNFVCPWRSH